MSQSNYCDFFVAFIRADENITFFTVQRDSCGELSTSDSKLLTWRLFFLLPELITHRRILSSVSNVAERCTFLHVAEQH